MHQKVCEGQWNNNETEIIFENQNTDIGREQTEYEFQF